MVLFKKGCAILLELLLLYMPIVMLIMLDALTLEDLLLIGVCSLIPHSFHRKARNIIVFPSHLLNINIGLCHKLVQKYSHYMDYLLSLVFAKIHLLLSIGIIPLQYILLQSYLP